MFCINVWLTAKNPAEADEIGGLLTEAGRLSRLEPGCLRFEVYQSESDARRFLLVERWESKAAWETHRKARAVTEIYLPQVLPRVDRDAHVCSLLE